MVRALWLYPWWLLWGFGRWLWWADNRWTPPEWWWDDGRRTSWKPVKCTGCGWRGPVRWLVHDYRDCGMNPNDGDVEGVDYCPKCGAEA